MTLQNGQKVVVDDNYVRESILAPASKVLAGYQPVMPTFQGLVNEEALAQRSLALLKVFTQNQYAEATHPISADIFWVRGGVWRPFGIEVGEGGVRVEPPEEMAGVLEELLAGG